MHVFLKDFNNLNIEMEMDGLHTAVGDAHNSHISFILQPNIIENVCISYKILFCW